VTCFALAGMAWLVAFASWVLAIKHRKPEITLGSLLASGLRAFDPSNFTDAGRAHQRRFLAAFAVFFAAIAAGVLASALARSGSLVP